jgi:hypothetical protein
MIGFALILDLSVYSFGVDHFTNLSWLFLGEQSTNTLIVVLATTNEAQFAS